MAWTWQTALFFGVIALLLVGMSVWEWRSPGRRAAPRHAAVWTRRAATACSSRCSPPAIIHLLWLALLRAPLWGASAVSLIVAVIVFRKA